MATSFEPIKFANLTEKTTAPSDADIIVIEDSTATKKAKWSSLISWIKSKLNIGSADISSIGDGTVTGAINTLNTKMYKLDFSSIVTGISHGTSVNSDGIVCLCIGITGNTDCRIYINNQEIGRIRWQSGSVAGTNVFPITFPVVAGTNITVSGLGSNASISNGYLIPYTK